jgi:hypothetical protein
MSPGQRRNIELLLSALGTVEPARRSTRRWNGWRGSKVASVENSVAVITRAQATGSCRQPPLHTVTVVTVGHQHPIYRTLGWRVSGRVAGGTGSILLDRCRRPSRRETSRSRAEVVLGTRRAPQFAMGPGPHTPRYGFPHCAHRPDRKPPATSVTAER